MENNRNGNIFLKIGQANEKNYHETEMIFYILCVILSVAPRDPASAFCLALSCKHESSTSLRMTRGAKSKSDRKGGSNAIFRVWDLIKDLCLP